MEYGVLLPEAEGVPPVEHVHEAERLGYDSAWLGELWGADAFVRLTEAACNTSSIRLGTAIVNVFSRSPAVLAMAASSLDRVSEGRFALGLGVSTPKVIENLHGMDYDRPVRRTHETAELVRRFTAGEGRVEYDGEVLSVADFPALSADVPLYNAALGPANRRATGRQFDGWMPHNVPFPLLEEAFETISGAARDAGRDPDQIRVAPYLPSAVSEDREEAVDALRGHVAYYVGSGNGYRNAVAQLFPKQADVVAERWRAGDRSAAVAAVTDEMVEALGAAGTPQEARRQLDAIVSMDVVDELLVDVPEQASDALYEGTVEALAPANQ